MLKSKELDEILNNKSYTFYAHTKESSSEKELLSEHLELTYKYYEKMKDEKRLNIIVEKLIKSIFNMDNENLELAYELFESAIFYHDIGKINPSFQKEKMDNDINLVSAEGNSNHSALSARLFIDTFIEKAMKSNCMPMVILVFIYAYIISRHHSNMEQMLNLYQEIKDAKEPELYKNKLTDERCEKIILDGIKPYLKNERIDKISMYILCKLLYSCLITADFYATYEYMTENKIEIGYNKDIHLFDEYENSKIYKSIRKYQNNEEIAEGINVLRNDIFIETEKSLIKNIDSNIYYLEAPTGAGKTNMAINLARILYENNTNIKSINYIFPFNTIIEQTQNTFSVYFEEYKDFITINSITNMVKDIDEKLDFERAYIKNVFRQYPIVITSHINLFGTLFGEGKEANYSLYNYINSVVVIDEIQSYSNNKWRQIIEMLDKYAEMLNIKFIIMSATLPRIDKLLNETKNKFTALVANTDKYYQSEIFKNRVLIDYSLLDKKITIEELSEEIIKNKDKKVLVECIKKKTANELYEKIKEKTENVYILTGDDNAYYRNKLIEKIKNSTSLILVSTQTIEAGVDIDMDIGYKDISFLDSEEQFLGRINRSNKKKNCKAYFFNYDEARSIYKSDNRIGLGVEKQETRQYLENKDFAGFYNFVLERVKKETEKYNNNNISNLFDNCKFMNFKKIEEIMKLINTDTIQLFLNYKIKIDGKEIVGADIYNEYKKLCRNNEIGYAEKKIRLSELSKEMNLFIYTIYRKEEKVITGEKFAGMFYIENGEEYMEDERFNRDLFLSEGDTLFI